MADRISSTSSGYETGDLSIYPEAIDDKESLYEATNNSTIALKQTMSYISQIVIVEDTSSFPPQGILRVGPPPGESGEFEMIYYNKKTNNTFQDIIRSFGGSKRGIWKFGESYVSNVVNAEHHNAIKDAVINMETNVGIKENPDSESLNGILKKQEDRFLAPRPLFRANPIIGPAPRKVRFQNFTTGNITRNLWDFGDGATSLEKNPTHNYLSEGNYTVKLNVVTDSGAQGVVTKSNYIVVDNDESIPFFYVEDNVIGNSYSQESADVDPEKEAKEFVFVDQSDGDITQRNWVFGDGTKVAVNDPDIHQISHTYQKPGEYIVTCLISFSNGRLKRVELPELLTVL